MSTLRPSLIIKIRSDHTDKPAPAAKIHEAVTHPKNIENEAVFDF